MYLHTLIEKQIPKLKLYNKHGKKIEHSLLMHEYQCIKNHLYTTYSSDDIVAIYLEKEYRYVLVLLACMSLGQTYIPLNNEWPKERIEQIQQFSKCHLITEEHIDFSQNIEETITARYANEILYIMFTSGSTGMPKGVKVKRSGFENFIQWTDQYFTQINSSDRMLLTTDFTFDISLVDISLLLTKSLTLYISNFQNNIFKMLFELESYKITTHSTVPYNYSMLLHDNIYPKGDLSSLKHVVLAGARFPENVYNTFNEKLPHVDVYNAYGPTEATIYCAIQKIAYNREIELHSNNVTIGKPLPNNQFKIVDDELLVSGKQLMLEYLNEPQKTKDVLVEIDNKLYYKTGDVVFQDDAGYYFITGRKDDTIKVSGYRVNLSDIDAYLMNVPYINNASTIAIENDAAENELVSYVILNDSSIDSKQIRNNLKKLMPVYQIAKYIKIVESFPLNNSNKICKHTLKKQFLQS